MHRQRVLLAVGFTVVAALLAGAGLVGLGAGRSVQAAPHRRPAIQGVQASGIITLGGGTCSPDAVLVDCNGTVIEQLKGPGGAGFFAPYLGVWVDLTGARQTCPAGATYLDVVTIQPATNPCQPTATPGGPTATPTPTVTPSGPTATPTVTPTATAPGAPANLALGKVVQASSTQLGQPPTNAVDGNPASFWASAPGYDPYAAARNVQWIQVDLGATFAVQKMHMTWGYWRHARGYSIYAWLDYCGGWCLIASTSYGDGDDTANFPEAVEAQNWMLWLVNPYLMGGHYELLEWEIEGAASVPAQSANLAVGKPAVSLNHEPPFEAARASDGDAATEWRSLNLPVWIYLDLMTTEEFDRAILRWSPGLHATRYTLYVWNGWLWTPVYDKTTGTGGEETAIFPRVRGRYFLLHATAGPAGKVGLQEFEVYRRVSPSGPPTPLLEGDWRGLRGAGRPDFAPAGVVLPPTQLPQSTPRDMALDGGPLDRSRLPNPERWATE